MSPSPREHSLQLAERLGTNAALCRVLGVEPLSPSLSAVRLGGPVASLGGQPGNDVMILAGETQGHVVRRRYSVRSLDEANEELTLWVTTGHDGAGSRWARTAEAAQSVDVIGPRGKILLDPHADWHLFVGDVSSMGAFYRMAEALEGPTQALFVLEVPHPEDVLTPRLNEHVAPTGVFVERADRHASDPSGLLGALSALELPEGHGHAYLFAEFSIVRHLEPALLERGFARQDISSKAFWRAGRANADHGEPVKSED